jgi:hypothetical protein
VAASVVGQFGVMIEVSEKLTFTGDLEFEYSMISTPSECNHKQAHDRFFYNKG